ncbi:hypothetical protein CVT26_010257, partial [Gymnopilus dilepis]
MYPIPVAPQGALPRVPPPRHRHGAPSGPWPFVDIDDEVDPARIQDPTSHLPLSASPCSHSFPPAQEQHFCWCKYPQSLYPNWTPRQQKKSGITSVIEGRKKQASTVYCLDVMRDGIFRDRGEREFSERTVGRVWAAMQEGRPPGVKVRTLFSEGLSGPVLQMLGTRYNIEPFFFTSTLGWIPSRFQSHVVPHESDRTSAPYFLTTHLALALEALILNLRTDITIILSFIKAIPTPRTSSTVPPTPNPSFLNILTRGPPGPGLGNWNSRLPDLVIDTQAPLRLSSSDRLLTHDLLAIHMVRSPLNHSGGGGGGGGEGSTIISLHPHPHAHNNNIPGTTTHNTPGTTTTAHELHTRVHLLGKSVYWANILKDTTDPTFVLLGLLWYGMYAWDEALEGLYEHICYLESKVIQTDDFTLTRELHAIRAHLLHYDSLLQDFRNTILFVKDTPHPGLMPRTDLSLESEAGSKANKHRMDRECGSLLLEVDRLERSRKMMESRLKNVMDL